MGDNLLFMVLILIQGREEWVLLENLAMEILLCQYILATCSVLEMKVKYTSVMEMNSQPVVLIAMMFQWSVYVSSINCKDLHM